MLNSSPHPNCDTVSQGGGEFLRELDAPQLCCGVLHFWHLFLDQKTKLMQYRSKILAQVLVVR